MKKYLRLATLFLAASALLASWSLPTSASAAAGPNLTVNAGANNKPISPYIYGMNFPHANLRTELQLPVGRYGGNRTSRYNWFTNTSGAGADWYFENRAEPTAPGQTLPNGSDTDQFFEASRAAGGKALLTMPMIGWRTKDATSCGYAISKYGAQQAVHPFRSDCGNGRTTSGAKITSNDPTDANVATFSSYYRPWVQHLVNKYGTAANGGVLFWNLDNEPDIWQETHFDIRPIGPSFAEMRDFTYDYAAMIKSVDPSAQTLGPVGFGWTSFRYVGKDKQTCDAQGGNCWNNPPDAAQYGNPAPWFLTWYLQQMRAYEQNNGVRILDYVDIHMYPQSVDGFNDDLNDATTNATRFRSVKGLWDRNYTDESWINTQMYFIPRMQEMIAAHYPGTKTAITEYRFGGLKHLSGALAQVDVLGVFGREGLDLATIWEPPTSSQPGAYAFRMFLNYNGSGGKFGDTSVSATSANQDQVSIYAAKRSSDGALTLMIVNKDPNNEYTSNVSLSGFNPGGSAQVWRYSGANLNAIVRQSDQAVGSGGFTATFPAYSATLIVIPAGTTSGGDGSPYGGTAVSLPGTVQAENYNTGGQGVAYNDVDTSNNGGQYRSEGVDIETCSDSGCGHNVGWVAAGEWQKYTVNVSSSGTYTLEFRVASAVNGGTFHLEVDGANVTGTMTMPNTGGWQTWQTVTKTGVNLSAGQRVLRLVADTSGGNFNWIRFATSGQPTFQPPTNTPSGGGTIRVQAETGTFTGAHARTSTTKSGYTGTGYVTGFEDPDDTVTVTVNAPVAGNYQVVLRYTSTVTGNGTKYNDLRANGGSPVEITFPNISNWANTTAVTVYLNAGNNSVEFRKSWGWVDVDYFDFTR
jgi:hypothetical protein